MELLKNHNKFFIFLFLSIFLVSSVYAGFGFDDPNLPKVTREDPTLITFNNITGSVNSSTYWNGMNLINSTQMENNAGVLNILVSWLDSLIESSFNSTAWQRSGTNVFLQNIGDKVGIGTTTPHGTLHILTADSGSGSLSTSFDDLVIENTDETGITILSPDNTDSGIVFGSPSNKFAVLMNWVFDNKLLSIGTLETDGEIAFFSGLDNEAMRIDSNGNIGINTSTPQNTLNVLGDVNITGDFIVGEGGEFFTIGVDSSGDLEFINDSSIIVFRLRNSIGTAEHIEGTKNNPGITFISDVDSGIFSPGNNILGFSAGTVEFLRFVESIITTDESVFNEDGLVIDFRVESSGVPNAFFVQGSDGNVGIGTASPDKLLEIEGTAAAILIDSSTNANLIIDRAGLNRQGNIDFKTGNILKWSIGSPDSDNGGDGSEFFIGTSPLGGNGAKFWIETNGNVGIGTTSPDAHLEVSGTGIQKIIINSTDGSEVALDLVSNTKFMRLFFRESDGDFGIWNGTLTKFRIDGDGHFELLGGNVGIGVTDPVTKLEVVTRSNTPLRAYRKTIDPIQNLMTLHSDVTSTENLKWRVEADGDTISDTGSYTSDERIKINIKPINNALDIILQLKPVSHEYIEGWTKPGIRYSFIAQDVEKVLPELVRDDGLDAPQFLKDQGVLTVKALRYNDFIAINTKAIQELKAENDLMRDRLAQLEERLNLVELMCIK